MWTLLTNSRIERATEAAARVIAAGRLTAEPGSLHRIFTTDVETEDREITAVTAGSPQGYVHSPLIGLFL